MQDSSSPFDITFKTQEKRKDEIGVLAKSIDEMIERIKQLNEEQKQTIIQQRIMEIKVLQAQIHPHFLGNTLACIQSLIKEEKLVDATQAIQSLTKLLNYTIGATDHTVTLEKELMFVNAYIHLWQMRSATPFSYQVYVPENHRKHLVPRLFLQPIVENSIVHGFSGSKKATGIGEITITSYEHKGHLFLCVDDNGVGTSAQRLTQVMQGEVEASPHAHGIGVQNVFKRLELHKKKKGSKSIITQNSYHGVRVLLDLGPLQGEK